MRALQEGDRVEIIDGVFKQLRGRITRMDRRRKTVRVELDTQGAIRHIWLSYEIVDRVDAERLPVAGDEGARGLKRHDLQKGPDTTSCRLLAGAAGRL